MADVTGWEVTIGTALIILNKGINWALGKRRDNKHKGAETHIAGKIDTVLEKVEGIKDDVEGLRQDVEHLKGNVAEINDSTKELSIHVTGDGGLLFRTRRLEGRIFQSPDDLHTR